MGTIPNRVDRKAHDEFYADRPSMLLGAKDIREYIDLYENSGLQPFFAGGTTKGYVRGETTKQLLKMTCAHGLEPGQVTVLDAGCGQGELSIYLACMGYKVIGVDISPVACNSASKLAEKFGVGERCTFLAKDLGHTSVAEGSVDFIIGHAALHHFIKYENIPDEFARILSEHGEGYFADSFGENKVYRLFHDKEKMKRLGDVPLTRSLIENFFGQCFEVEIKPTDWITMLDKLYLKVLPKKLEWIVRRLSRFHFWLDRRIPASSGIALFLSGAVMTTIRKVKQE